VQAHVVQHGEVPVVGEADVLHVNASLGLAQVARVRRVPEGRLRAHDLREALKARGAVGKQLGEVGELADGVHEGRDIEREGDEVDIVELLFHDEQAAHRDDRDREDAHEKLHERHEDAHFLVEHPLGGLEGLVGGVELLLLQLLVGERLGRAHAREARLNVGVDGAGPLLDAAGAVAHLAAARHDDVGEHRHDDAHDERQPPLDRKHGDERARDCDERNEQILRPVVGQLRNLEQVAREAADQLARAVAVEEVEAQLLHVVEERLADVGLDADAEGVSPERDDVVQKRPQHVCQHDDAHDGEKRAVGVVRQQVVHGRPRDERIGEIDRGDQKRAGHVQREQPAVRLKKGEEDLQKTLLPVFLRAHAAIHSFAFSFYYSMGGRRLQGRCNPAAKRV